MDELADPLGVRDVGLAPGDVAQVMRVEQPALEAILERLKDSLPVHAGGLHPDRRDAALTEPRAQRRQPRQASR